ncbi:MAG TPA: helix-hairpin-helix domain-containing protein [Bryobacteraceae bacterium]|jgi:competence ComEA-like helix-hairpin-helix protein|nr:helix-hairpin-helix domain-containing protein [Bryobacteraceae bacterium]
MPSRAAWVLLAALLAPAGRAAELPDGAGKDILLRACTGCHKAEEFLSYRHTKEEYQAIVQRMGQRGARASNDELDIIADYLAKNFLKVEDPNKININKATARQIETGLSLTAKEAEAIVDYRERHGDFHAWGDLLVIYGVDGKKIEAAKERMSF